MRHIIIIIDLSDNFEMGIWDRIAIKFESIGSTILPVAILASFLTASSCGIKMNSPPRIKKNASPFLIWSPLSYDFGSVSAGSQSSDQVFTLTNSGLGTASGCSDPVLLDNTNFSIVSHTCTESTLAFGGGDCTTTVHANPATAGLKQTTLSRTCSVGGVISTSINEIQVTGIGVNLAWAPLIKDFGNVYVGGNSSTQIFTLTNSGTADASGCSTPVLGDNTNFTITAETCATTDLLGGGGACTTTVKGNPTTLGLKQTTLTRTCSSGGTVSTTTNEIKVTGVSAILAWSPLIKDFGNINIGASSTTQVFTLTNTGTGDASGCSAPTLSDNTHFTLTTNTCGTSDVTNSGGTCTATVKANPTSSGLKQATLTRVCTSGGTITTTALGIEVTGVGPTMAWTPLTKDFGTIAAGSSSTTQVFTLSNTGVADATGCTAPTVGDSTNFTVVSNTCGTSDLVATSGTCTATVQANPTVGGVLTTTLSRTCTFGGTVSTTTDGIQVTSTTPPATKLVFSVQPTDTAAGGVMPSFTVQAQTAGGLVDTAYTGTITIALAGNSGRFETLSGTISFAMVAGVGTFSAVTITGDVASNLTLIASSGTLTSAVSTPFQVVVGNATKLAFTVFKTNRPVRTCFPFTVQSQDAAGNAKALGSSATIALNSTSSGSGIFYSDSSCTAVITSVSIASSGKQASFYFKNSVAETLTVTATADVGAGLNAANRSITIVGTGSGTWIANASGASNVPLSYNQHSAVWTRAEMIILGYNNVTSSTTSGRYNPTTDSWGGSLSLVGAPSSRRAHTAIWTGTEMIVWGGGQNLGSPENTGGRYNPASDTWGTATTTSGAPSARSSHSAVWTGTEMIVLWGADLDGFALSDGGRYNPSSDTWGDRKSVV